MAIVPYTPPLKEKLFTKNPFEKPQFANELVLHIFSYLNDPRDLLNCAQVCLRFHAVTHEKSLWTQCIENDSLFSSKKDGLDKHLYELVHIHKKYSLRQFIHKITRLTAKRKNDPFERLKKRFSKNSDTNDYFVRIQKVCGEKLLKIYLNKPSIDVHSYGEFGLNLLRRYILFNLLARETSPNCESLDVAIELDASVEVFESLVAKGAKCYKALLVCSTLRSAICARLSYDIIELLVAKAQGLPTEDEHPADIEYNLEKLFLEALKMGCSLKTVQLLHAHGIPIPKNCLDLEYLHNLSLTTIQYLHANGAAITGDTLANMLRRSNCDIELLTWLLNETNVRFPKPPEQESHLLHYDLLYDLPREIVDKDAPDELLKRLFDRGLIFCERIFIPALKAQWSLSKLKILRQYGYKPKDLASAVVPYDPDLEVIQWLLDTTSLRFNYLICNPDLEVTQEFLDAQSLRSDYPSLEDQKKLSIELSINKHPMHKMLKKGAPAPMLQELLNRGGKLHETHLDLTGVLSRISHKQKVPLETVQFLVAHKAKADDATLNLALRHRYDETFIEYLLTKVNASINNEQTTKNNSLSIAIYKGYSPKMIRLMLELGAVPHNSSIIDSENIPTSCFFLFKFRRFHSQHDLSLLKDLTDHGLRMPAMTQWQEILYDYYDRHLIAHLVQYRHEEGRSDMDEQVVQELSEPENSLSQAVKRNASHEEIQLLIESGVKPHLGFVNNTYLMLIFNHIQNETASSMMQKNKNDVRCTQQQEKIMSLLFDNTPFSSFTSPSSCLYFFKLLCSFSYSEAIIHKFLETFPNDLALIEQGLNAAGIASLSTLKALVNYGCKPVNLPSENRPLNMGTLTTFLASIPNRKSQKESIAICRFLISVGAKPGSALKPLLNEYKQIAEEQKRSFEESNLSPQIVELLENAIFKHTLYEPEDEMIMP